MSAVGKIHCTPLGDRILELCHPEPNTGCWLWMGAVNKRTGYGVISAGRRGEGTYKAHRASVMSKLDIHKATGLVRLAIREGLIAP